MKRERKEERGMQGRKGEIIESGVCARTRKEQRDGLSVCVSCDTAPSLRRFVLFVCPTYLLNRDRRLS